MRDLKKSDDSINNVTALRPTRKVTLSDIMDKIRERKVSKKQVTIAVDQDMDKIDASAKTVTVSEVTPAGTGSVKF